MRLPRAHGHVLKTDEGQVLEPDTPRPDAPSGLVNVLLVLGLHLHDEAVDGLRHVARKFGAGDRVRWATEVPRGDLSAPGCIARPLQSPHNVSWGFQDIIAKERLTLSRMDTEGPRPANIESSRPSRLLNLLERASLSDMPQPNGLCV